MNKLFNGTLGRSVLDSLAGLPISFVLNIAVAFLVLDLLNIDNSFIYACIASPIFFTVSVARKALVFGYFSKRDVQSFDDEIARLEEELAAVKRSRSAYKGWLTRSLEG